MILDWLIIQGLGMVCGSTSCRYFPTIHSMSVIINPIGSMISRISSFSPHIPVIFRSLIPLCAYEI
jgi:hypothetical protein